MDLASSYAVGKYAQEILTNSICRNIAHTNLRLSSLFGKEFEQRVTNKMVKQCLAGKEIRVAVGGRRFAFMDVRDASEAILRLAGNTFSTWGEIYNIGSIQGYTLEEMAQEIVGIYKEITGKSIPIVLQGETEWENSEVNCKKFMKQFNWAPHYSFHDTIVDMFNYYSREGNNIYA